MTETLSGESKNGLDWNEKTSAECKAASENLRPESFFCNLGHIHSEAIGGIKGKISSYSENDGFFSWGLTSTKKENYQAAKAEEECEVYKIENDQLTEDNSILSSENNVYKKTLGTIQAALASSGFKK